MGMTKNKLNDRFRIHCWNKKTTMYEPIQRIGKEHFTIIPIDHAHDKKEALSKESFWTLFYQKKFILYNKNIGNIPNDETRKKMSNSRKGEKNPFYGKHHSDEAKRKNVAGQKKCPVQCIETGIEYISLSEAARQTNIDISCIMRVCKGQKYTAGGFHWRYVNAA